MTRLIDADVLLQRVNEVTLIGSYLRTWLNVVIDEQPTIKPEPIEVPKPVRHGKWLYRKFEVYGLEYAGNCYCSACGTDALTNDGIEYMTRFCPNCGARMYEE